MKRKNKIHGKSSSPIFYRKTLFVFLLICLFLSLNIAANTNGIDNDYQVQMNRDVVQLESQWDSLCVEADNFAFMIQNSENANVLFNELMDRTKNKSDMLNGLEKYEPIFSLGGGVALTLYNVAYDMYYRQHELRAGNLFLFLINKKNINKFTVGNSYHWLGTICYEEYKDNEMAFKYFLKVHKYPACLVFTANAYVFAAEILNKMGQADNALALLAVDVPTYKYKNKLMQRHIMSYSICKNKNDITNAVRHLQVAYLADTNIYNTIKIILQTFPKWCEKYWWETITNCWSETDIMSTINNGISNPHETPDDDLFFDAVTHKWPAVYEVSRIILTNRTLSNNIFPQERRAFDVKKRRKLKARRKNYEKKQ